MCRKLWRLGGDESMATEQVIADINANFFATSVSQTKNYRRHKVFRSEQTWINLPQTQFLASGNTALLYSRRPVAEGDADFCTGSFVIPHESCALADVGTCTRS
jgi:hypothetical protein